MDRHKLLQWCENVGPWMLVLAAISTIIFQFIFWEEVGWDLRGEGGTVETRCTGLAMLVSIVAVSAILTLLQSLDRIVNRLPDPNANVKRWLRKSKAACVGTAIPSVIFALLSLVVAPLLCIAIAVGCGFAAVITGIEWRVALHKDRALVSADMKEVEQVG